MLKKILGILLIPTMVISIFAGCGKDHNLADVKKLYNRMIDKYSYEVDAANQEKDSYFFKTIVVGDKAMPGVKLEIKYKGELAKVHQLENSYASLKDDDKNLYNRYYALVAIEQRLLDWIYNYYDNWDDNLYESEKISKDVKKSDVEKLYKNLKKLDKAIGKFAVEKSKAEDEIDSISFEGAINLTSFTYAFNDLIEASLNFVNTFRDIHVKYIWNTYTFGENVGANKTLLNRIIDEAYLNMAQVIYYENVKTFEYSECDLNPLIQLVDETVYSEEIIYPLLNEATALKNGKSAVLVSAAGGARMFNAEDVVLNPNKSTDANGDPVAETYDDRLQDYIYFLKAFNQKVNIYKRVYKDFDIYEYNQVRLGLGAVNFETYVNGLDRVERANLALLQDFANETFADYAENFAKIFNN